MAHVEAPSFPGRLEHPNPVERLGRWAGEHWKSSLSLVLTALGAGYLLISHDRGPQNPPQPTTPASDTFPDSEIGVIIPTIKTPTPQGCPTDTLPESSRVNTSESRWKGLEDIPVKVWTGTGNDWQTRPITDFNSVTGEKDGKTVLWGFQDRETCGVLSTRGRTPGAPYEALVPGASWPETPTPTPRPTPERPTPVPTSTPEAPRVSSEIVLNTDSKIVNMGTKYRIVVNDGGFRDANGNFCPDGYRGGACKGYNSGMAGENSAYARAIFAKYNTAGEVFMLEFSDVPGVGQQRGSYYTYLKETVGNTTRVRISLTLAFSINDSRAVELVNYAVNLAICDFLTNHGVRPNDIDNYIHPSKFTVAATGK